MQIAEIILIAFALSLDALAVSVAAATSGRITGHRATFRLSFHFGLFQFFMPILGWLAGTAMASVIAPIDHWIAFILLSIVGGRMVRSENEADTETAQYDPSRGFTLVMLATATSIDALAVGLSLAMLGVDIWLPSIIIGVITASVSLAGILLGNCLQEKFGRTAEIVGGIVLILIGLRILITHTILV